MARPASVAATLGAIALQGEWRAARTLGESIMMVGPGILGRITVASKIKRTSLLRIPR